MAFFTPRASCREASDMQMDPQALRNDTPSRLAPIFLPPSAFSGETISRAIACAGQSTLPRRSSQNPTNVEGTGRQLPPELRFTAVNSTSENSQPVKPNRSAQFLPSEALGKTHQRHARNCRLIGFTPLVEEVLTSSEEDTTQFLGPRKVKAKEVAPCALFYKRADVFVSSEMRSQNVLTYSHNHYCKMQFDNEVSVRELEYVDEHPDRSKEVAEAPMNLTDRNAKKRPQEDRCALKVKIEPSLVHEERVCQTFAKDGLTSAPLASDVTPGFRFGGNPFHIYTDETDSPLTGISSADRNIPWAYDLASDLEQSTSSISSSGIQSNPWDSILASSSRATSPVSSIYSSISSSCHVQPLATSTIQDQFIQPRCKLTEFSLFRLKTEQENVQNEPNQGPFDWQEHNGNMADDEDDSDNSSIQLESDGDY